MKIQQISAGRERSVALNADGEAFAWGGVKVLGATLPPGYPGELCTTGATEIGHNRFAQPLPQRLNPNMPFSAVVDGYADLVAVQRGGSVLSCRPIVSQETGASRTAIPGLPPAAVQVTLTETGGLALYADGSVWSWGLAAQGQLGRQVETSTRLRFQPPAAVDALVPMSMIAAGQGHVLALGRDGSVWSWGANAAGQLGHGGLVATARPQKVAHLPRIQRVAAGDTHSLAVDGLGRLWSWGSNNFGQAGDPSGSYFTRPVQVKAGFPVAQVDAGMFYTVATSTQGEVFAWGWNGMGQLGRQDVNASVKPLRVPQLAKVKRLAAGVGHTLALTDTGVFAWGDNRASECGNFPSIAVQAQPTRIALA